MMPDPFKILISYFLLLPLILGAYKFYNSVENLRLIGKQMRPLSRIIKDGTPTRYLAYATLVNSILLLLLALMISCGIKPNKIFTMTTLVVQALIPVALLTAKLNLIELTKKYKSILKWAVSITAISTAFIASIYVDKFITEITHSRAENFPSAQYLLTAIGSAFIYYMLAAVIGLAIYTAQGANLFYIMLSQSALYKTKKRALRILLRLKPSRTSSKDIDMTTEMALLVGLSFFTVVMLTLPGPYLTEKFLTTNIQRLIVFSSFHGKGKDCGIEDENVEIAILPFGKMIVAGKTDNNSYDFKPGECKPDKKLLYPNQKIKTIDAGSERR